MSVLETHSLMFSTGIIASPPCSPFPFLVFSSASMAKVLWGLVRQVPWQIRTDVKKGKIGDSTENQFYELSLEL